MKTWAMIPSQAKLAGTSFGKGSPAQKQLREAVARILHRHGFNKTTQLYKERGVYNFYLKEDAGAAELAPLEQQQLAPQQQSPPSGNQRRAQKP